MARIVIIGGGVAGLSAGIYAQMAGHHAHVCEKHVVAGGNLTGWRRGAYHIDNCIHWLTGTNEHTTLYRMWEELGALGRGIDVYQAEALYTCMRDGETLSLYRDAERLEREMLALSLRDEKQIRTFIGVLKAVQGYSGIGGEKHDRKSTARERLATLPSLASYSNLSTGALAERFHHPLLRDFVLGVLGTEFSATSLAVIAASFCGENGGIPRGGSCAMAARMVRRLEELGGELHLKKEATRVLHGNGMAHTVVFSDGTSLSADYVILAADPAVMVSRLLELPMPTRLAREYHRADAMRFSSCHCAFACDASCVPFRGDLIFEMPRSHRERLGANYIVLREFSHEESFAPAGETVLQGMVCCDEQTARGLIELKRDAKAYAARKREIAGDVQDLIAEKLPSLRDGLRLLDVWTPATYQRYTGAEVGSWMGFVLRAGRMPHKVDNTLPQVKNVVLATQWLRSPGGLPFAALEGKRAVETVTKKIAASARPQKTAAL